MHQIVLKGDGKARGQAHGEHFRKEIRELVQIRKELLAGYLTDERQVDSLCMDLLDVLKHHQDLYDEFVEMAKASDCTLQDLTILNNYTDMRDFRDDQGCSLFSYRQGEEVLCGQTWDMHASAAPYTIYMKIESEPVQHILSLTGCLGMAGVSGRSLSVMINNLWSTEHARGLMWPALVRAMLNCHSAEEALMFLRTHRPASGHNYLICDPKESINVECTGKRDVLTYRGDSGSVCHTNHYLSELKSTQKELKKESTTLRRYEEMEAYFVSKEDLSRSCITRDVFAAGIVKSVAMPLPEDLNRPTTCGGLILDLQKKEGEAFARNYKDGDHLQLRW